MKNYLKLFIFNIFILTLLFPIKSMAVKIPEELKVTISNARDEQNGTNCLESLRSKLCSFVYSLPSLKERLEAFWQIRELLNVDENEIAIMRQRKASIEESGSPKIVFLNGHNICVVGKPISRYLTPQVQSMFSLNEEEKDVMIDFVYRIFIDSTILD